MNAKLYFAVMLLTEPQKTRRILLAEELENWFMDLFDEEYEDVLNGTFASKQEEYIDRIVDKYLEVADVKITATDNYSKEVIDKAIKTATQIQETTMNNILKPKAEEENDISALIAMGIAFGGTVLGTDSIKKWFDEERANLIGINEANWICNHDEYEEAKSKYSKKIWHTALDEKVRLTHMAVESAEVPIDEPFHVGGYQMMFPCDASMGAGAEEIINCRCTVEYK